MRVSHIEARLEQQLTTRELIMTSFENFSKIGYDNITSQRVAARLTALKEAWDTFFVFNEAVNLAMKQISFDDNLQLRQHPYFSENLFSSTYECYLESIEKINSFLEKDSDVTNEIPSNPTSSQNSNIPIFFHHTRLPRIDIPKFNGSPSEWLSFKDLFSSLILNNPTLSSVEKLQYLKTNLTGSASHLLKNTTLTSDNFQKAWDALISFYENRRLLVNAALNSLFSLKRMTKESAVEMEQLYSNITQIHRSLETLKRPISMWDDIFVFVAVQRLDSESVKAWEHHLGSSKDPPTWKQFNEFLLSRLLSLQAFEKSRFGKQFNFSHPSSAKSHFQGKSKENNSYKPNSCFICSSNHFTSKCPQYNSKTLQQRLAIISKHKLCYNCLGPHKISDCRVLTRCIKCGNKHHTSIHRNQKPQIATSTSSSSTDPTSLDTKPAKTQVLHSSSQNKFIGSTVLLATAQVFIISENEEAFKIRALIDQGSEISLISERVVQLLHLPRNNSSVSLYGIGGQRSNTTKGSTYFTLKSRFNPESQIKLTAHILPKLTMSLPSIQLQHSKWPHLKGLNLADPNYTSPGSIDIILGADVYSRIIEEGLVKGKANLPIAQRSIFGWIISGPSCSQVSFQSSQSYHTLVDKEFFNVLQRFWQLEEVSSSNTSTLSNDEQDCEKHYQTTHTRDQSGRYIVRLPFKFPTTHLGDSSTKAHKIIINLSRKFSRDPLHASLYSDFLEEYEQLGHMTKLSDADQDVKPNYYLPHHGVTRTASLTTKLRVVFNGSSITGLSLNDLLYTGPKLQKDVFEVLIWFRQFRYVFSSDIEKMYRQIRVHPEDQQFQRIFWINKEGTITTYQLTTVTYGLSCAPFLALRTLSQLVKDEGEKYPLAIPSLSVGRYVDDIFGGADTISQAKEIAQQVDALCKAGGFPLQKWVSNHPTILDTFKLENQIKSLIGPIEDSTTIHILGLVWNPSTDTFQFSVISPSSNSWTKRSTLSTLAKVFDPLGFLSPIVITAKIFLQELWSIKVGWDDPLPMSSLNKWLEFLQNLQDIPKLTFPRWIGFKQGLSYEIHGFSDASQHAMCAVVYIKSFDQTGKVSTHFVCSKTKVSPLKKLTIPRLELAGTVLLTNLVARIIPILKPDIPIFLWTDSAIAFTWINNHPSRWKEFVQNRVCHIQETLPQAIWKFVPGKDNPADCATRGLTTTQLLKSSIWINGPSWLLQDNFTWPQETKFIVHKDKLEERVQVSHVNINFHQPWDLINKYSNLTRLLRITVLCKRAISVFQKKQIKPITNPITTQEIEWAKLYWIKQVQNTSFIQERKLLLKGKPLPRSHNLLRLTPFFDSEEILRVGGRLHNSMLPYNSKHPIILPKDSSLSQLIIADAHIRTMHGGTQSTLTFIRNYYWIIGGRAPVRSFILKCVQCARYRQSRALQIMGQLPPERTTRSRPFLNSGIDYAGPILLKNWRGKNSRTYKAWIALFVCLATSAIHLELVTDCSSEAFLAAYKRFSSRRGICSILISDCGTNLKGADSELKRLFTESSKEWQELSSLLAHDGTQWKFNPPSTPHFGGKWEAGVKSVKHHLKRVVGHHQLTYEEMYTLLNQIEAVLNSRPLCALTNDPDDLQVLTPAHFLIGDSLSTIPEPSLEAVKISHLSRWQLTRQMLESFWSHWKKEYLQRHLAVYKWNQETAPLNIGSLVLVIDERYPPSKWPLGRIIESHPGTDGKVRVVTVRTQTSTFKRPIVKLCLLPVPIPKS